MQHRLSQLITSLERNVVIGVETGRKTYYISPATRVVAHSGEHLSPGNRDLFVFSSFNEASFAKNVTENNLLRSRVKKSLEEHDIAETVVYSAFLYECSEVLSSGHNYFEATALQVAQDRSSEVAALLRQLEVGPCYKLSFGDGILLRGLDESGESSFEFEANNITRPECHPAFFERNTNSVCHNYTTALEILNQFKHLDVVTELLTITSNYVSSPKELPHKSKFPVVVLEGLDASGKTTLCENISKNLDVAVLKSPPSCIEHLRAEFDKQAPPLRRSYYSLGNYIFSKIIATQEKPVICDRFWHSTAAYAISTDVKNGDQSNLPPRGHWVWSWPQDLMKPDV